MFKRKKSAEALLEETHAQAQLNMFDEAMRRERKRPTKRIYEV